MSRRKIKLFREMINPELSKDLGLHKLSRETSDKNYFFSEKDVDKNYQFRPVTPISPTEPVAPVSPAGPFEIYVEKVFFQQSFVIIPIEITCDGFLHRMFLAYDSDENIHYGSQMGQEGIIKIEQMLGPERYEMLDDATEQVVDDLIPEDFWEVRGYTN